MGPDTSLDRTGDMLAAMGSLDIRPSAEAPIRFPMFTIQENVAIHGEKIRSPSGCCMPLSIPQNSLPSRRPNCQLLFVCFRISPLHLSSSSAEPDFPPSYFSGSPPAAAVSPSLLQIRISQWLPWHPPHWKLPRVSAARLNCNYRCG